MRAAVAQGAQPFDDIHEERGVKFEEGLPTHMLLRLLVPPVDCMGPPRQQVMDPSFEAWLVKAVDNLGASCANSAQYLSLLLDKAVQPCLESITGIPRGGIDSGLMDVGGTLARALQLLHSHLLSMHALQWGWWGGAWAVPPGRLHRGLPGRHSKIKGGSQ